MNWPRMRPNRRDQYLKRKWSNKEKYTVKDNSVKVTLPIKLQQRFSCFIPHIAKIKKRSKQDIYCLCDEDFIQIL